MQPPPGIYSGRLLDDNGGTARPGIGSGVPAAGPARPARPAQAWMDLAASPDGQATGRSSPAGFTGRARPGGTGAPSWTALPEPSGAAPGGRRPPQSRGGYAPGEVNPFAEPAEPSLTGHILAQGRPDTEVRGARSTKVMIAMLVVLCILVIGGLAAAIFAGDQVGSMFNSFFRSG